MVPLEHIGTCHNLLEQRRSNMTDKNLTPMTDALDDEGRILLKALLLSASMLSVTAAMLDGGTVQKIMDNGDIIALLLSKKLLADSPCGGTCLMCRLLGGMRVAQLLDEHAPHLSEDEVGAFEVTINAAIRSKAEEEEEEEEEEAEEAEEKDLGSVMAVPTPCTPDGKPIVQ